MIYGNYGLWAWLRYWWIDTENMIAMLLADKSYHDYDCDWTEPRQKPKADAGEPLSDDEVAAMLGGLYDPATGKRIFVDAGIGDLDSAGRIQRGLRDELGLENED